MRKASDRGDGMRPFASGYGMTGLISTQRRIADGGGQCGAVSFSTHFQYSFRLIVTSKARSPSVTIALTSFASTLSTSRSVPCCVMRSCLSRLSR